MPAEEGKPSAWKADGRWLETKEAGQNAQPLSFMCALERETGLEPATLLQRAGLVESTFPFRMRRPASDAVV